MRLLRAFRTVMIVAALVAVIPPAWAQDAARGAALLADARKAIGGEERLRAVRTIQANGTFRRSVGNSTLEGDVEVLIEAPDKFRRNESTGFAGGPTADRTEVLNGTEVWDQNSGGGPGGFIGGGGGRGFGGGGDGGRGRFGGGFPGAQAGQGDAQGGQRQIDPERIKEAQRRTRQADLSRLMLVWLLTTDAPVTWAGTAQSPDGTADVLELTPQAGVPTRLFLDSATHVPLMITWTAGAPRIQFSRRGGGGGGDQAGAAPTATPAAPSEAAGDAQPRRGGAQSPPPQLTVEMHLAQYKVVNGIKLPHLITRGVNGQTNEEWEVKSYKINPTFKSNTFTK